MSRPALSFVAALLPVSFLLCLLLSADLSATPRAAHAADGVPEPEREEPHIQPPAGFVDAATISDVLPRIVQDQSVPDGELLKVYLPDAAAQRYAEGRLDAVTRLVAVYGVKHDERRPQTSLDKKGLELAARTLEGAFAGYETVPEDTFKDAGALDEALRAAADAGTPVLATSVHTDNAVGYVTQIPFLSGPDSAVAAAMATALVLVEDRLIFVTASSFVTDNAPAAHAAWVKSTVEAFADMLASANKN